MTAKNVNKSSARDLAALTGMPYQSCLTTVQVLRALPSGVSLADLEPLLSGSKSGQALLNLPGSNEIKYEGVLPLAFGTGDGDAEVIVMAQDEPLLAVRACNADWGLPPNGASLWLEATLGEDLLRPVGAWRTTAKRLLGAAKSGAGETTAVLADRADGFESMGTVLSRDISKTAFIAERLSTAAPTYTTEGPGFYWAHFTFADLDQLYPPDEQDHRLVSDCDGYCGFLHDWPTANPAHTQIAMPAPLVAAYRKVMELAGPDPDGFDNELSFRYGITEDGSHWYGLDVYFPHAEQLEPLNRVWMQVDPPTTGSNHFPPAVS